MPASYPSSVKTFTTKVDGAGNIISASHVNDIQDEVNAIEGGLLNGVAHDIKPSTDASRDLGTATFRFRELFLSSIARVGSAQPVSDNTGDLGTAALRFRDVYVGTSVRAGTNPATAGAVRLANAAGIQARNAANTLDLVIVDTTAGNVVRVGDGSVVTGIELHTSGATAIKFNIGGSEEWRVDINGVYPATALDNLRDLGGVSNRVRDIYLGSSVRIGTNPATVGAVRLANAGQIVGRNAANSADRQLVAINASDRIELGNGTTDLQWMTALVALGGGAAPTFGTIGGSGPATAAQNTWMRVIDSTGAAFWVPAWK